MNKLTVRAAEPWRRRGRRGRRAGSATQGDRNRLGTLLDSSELGSLPPVEPLIDDVVSLRASVVMVGPSRVGKTFCALGLAASVATGTPWLGDKVLQVSPVLYVVGEGASGLGDRLASWCQRYTTASRYPRVR